MWKRIRRIFSLRSISQKIIAGFLFIYFFFIANGVVSIITIQDSSKEIAYISQVESPSVFKINEFRLKVAQSQSYIQAWIYQPSSTRRVEGEALRTLHSTYPEFKDGLKALQKKWKVAEQTMKMDSLWGKFEVLQNYQKDVMQLLGESEDYKNERRIEQVNNTLIRKILPLGDEIQYKTNQLIEQIKRGRENKEKTLLKSFEWLVYLTIILGSVLIFVGIFISWWTRRQIVNPIKYINSVFIKLGLGELPEDKHYKFNNDEIGEMAESADKLVYGLKSTTAFAESIGSGNYDADYTPLSDQDILGNALLEMRTNLATVAEGERRRSWANEGLVKFSELLKQNLTIDVLSDLVISNLVKYLKANQGGLFVVEDANTGLNLGSGRVHEAYLKLLACYAWDRKKYLEQRIFKGDGLAGQAWQEKGTIYLTDVPEGYVRITSGLGESNPDSILIVPLKINEEIFGIIEVASFHRMEQYEIEFVEKVAESIASTLASVKINERTQRLLEESTMVTEQMKSQEEEMRQNMEVLESNQKQIEVYQKEYKEKETLFNFAYLMIETDKRFAIKEANEIAETKLKYDSVDLEGMPIDYLFANYDKFEETKAKLEKGNKHVDFIYLKNKQNQKLFVRMSASAIRDEGGQIHKFLFILDDITDAKS
jgi:PAS domain S-box-containing protein